MDRKDKLFIELIDKMLEPHGVSFDDVRLKPVINGEDWFSYFTMTPIESQIFRGWAINRIRKVMKCSIAAAVRDFDWFWLAYGLREDSSNNFTTIETDDE